MQYIFLPVNIHQPHISFPYSALDFFLILIDYRFALLLRSMADTKNEDAQKVCYAFAFCMHIRAAKFGADTFWVVYVFHGSIVMATNTVFQGHGPMQFHSLHMYL